jgi:hypothetical protein
MGKARLGVVVTDVAVAEFALDALSTPAAERDGNSLTRTKVSDRFAHSSNGSGEFVTWNMGKFYVGVVAHPSVPVASANAAGFDIDHCCVILWNQIV